MASIRHFPATHPMPDWRNFGVMLRVLLGGNLLLALGVLVMAGEPSQWGRLFLEQARIVEPLLLMFLGALILLRDLLRRLSLRLAQVLVVALAVSLGLLWQQLLRSLGWPLPGSSLRAAVLMAVGCAVLLYYFELRSRAFSPAQSEARLAALNARIRPHFLFNALNTVLSLIRLRPQQAEEALEALADLFRAAMRDPSARVTLAEEIALSRQYLSLEKLRLGERLRVNWQIGDVSTMNLPIPPLMLQPLLENAVRHGIEPLTEGGEIRILIDGNAEELSLRVGNPVAAGRPYVEGNQIALGNIQERLALYYDLEARLAIQPGDTYYEVRITLPCRNKDH